MSPIFHLILHPGGTYACAAVTAASADYVIDVAVKRMMHIHPHLKVAGLIRTAILMIREKGVRQLYRGLGVKVRDPLLK